MAQVRRRWKVSVTWPPLSSSQQCLTRYSSAHLELVKRTSHPQQHISFQSRLYKGRKGEHRRRRVILMNIWQSFLFFSSLFLLYPYVDSLSDSYKNPSFTLVCLTLTELAGDIFSTHWPWETNSDFQKWIIPLYVKSFILFSLRSEENTRKTKGGKGKIQTMAASLSKKDLWGKYIGRKERGAGKRDVTEADQFIFSLPFLSRCSHAVHRPFIRGEGFSLAGAITFNNSPCESERRLASFHWQLTTTNVSGRAARGACGGREGEGNGGGGFLLTCGSFKNLTSSQHSALHVTCPEICFERPVLILYVWRPDSFGGVGTSWGTRGRGHLIHPT